MFSTLATLVARQRLPSNKCLAALLRIRFSRRIFFSITLPSSLQNRLSRPDQGVRLLTADPSTPSCSANRFTQLNREWVAALGNFLFYFFLTWLVAAI